jgi:AraC-like DNA-binding protein
MSVLIGWILPSVTASASCAGGRRAEECLEGGIDEFLDHLEAGLLVGPRRRVVADKAGDLRAAVSQLAAGIECVLQQNRHQPATPFVRTGSDVFDNPGSLHRDLGPGRSRRNTRGRGALGTSQPGHRLRHRNSRLGRGAHAAHLRAAACGNLRISSSRFVQRIRVEVAVQLLATTSLSVEETSARVGYADASTLRRILKRETGRAPRALRG